MSNEEKISESVTLETIEKHLEQIDQHLKKQDPKGYKLGWAPVISVGLALIMPAASVYLKPVDYALGWAIIGMFAIIFSIVMLIRDSRISE